MLYDGKAWIASGQEPVFLNPAMANRHGLITGATGTGKTVTLKVMAEAFSAMGVPVFVSDVKGDLTGICKPGVKTEKIADRLERTGAQEVWEPMEFPTRFWDIFGEQGHPVRVTVSDMGPTLLARLLSLTEVQEGVLNLVFHIADEQGLLLLDMKDLRSMLSFCAEHHSEFTTEYGKMSPQSIGAIQRAMLTLEQQGGDIFFGEPGLNIQDWIMTDENDHGYINLLNASKLVRSPLLYSTFLLWMLSELFEKLPEEGDMEIPKLVFFFDEAHLLFTDAPKALVEKVTQIVKLIRSKGVGVYFISQSIADIPAAVLSQLQNRVQHAVHAYTPAEQKAVRIAAETFRPNPQFSTAEAICNLGVGEALFSFLDEQGVPGIVEIGQVLPPQSLMEPADADSIQSIISSSEMEELYREPIDRESAYEILHAQEEQEAMEEAMEEERKEREKAARQAEKIAAGELRRLEREAAAMERERRKQETAMMREAAASRRNTGRSYTAAPPASKTRRSSDRSYGERAHTGSRKGSGAYSGYGYGMDPGMPPLPPVPPVPAAAEIGRKIGTAITRGCLGSRRW